MCTYLLPMPIKEADVVIAHSPKVAILGQISQSVEPKRHSTNIVGQEAESHSVPSEQAKAANAVLKTYDTKDFIKEKYNYSEEAESCHEKTIRLPKDGNSNYLDVRNMCESVRFESVSRSMLARRSWRVGPSACVWTSS